MRRRPRHSRPSSGRTPGAHATRDFQDFLRSDLDLIEILTPHPLHEAMTVAALAGGVTCQRAEADGDDAARMRSHDRRRRR